MVCEKISVTRYTKCKMGHKLKPRKKVLRKNGKRYYRTRSGLVKLRWNQKPPRLK